MTWILIVMVYANMVSSQDFASLTNVPGFISKEACEQAGNDAISLTKGKAQMSTRYVCVKQVYPE